jgi:hypothetical protein
MSKNTAVECPDCGSQIDVNEILRQQLEENIRNEFQQKQATFIRTSLSYYERQPKYILY